VTPLVGLLPAAGRGTRFGSSGYIKELFPIFPAAGDKPVEPRPICELSLRAIRDAGAERCLVVVSHEKSEILRVLGGGGYVGMSLAYLVQEEPRGLPHVIRSARPWLGDADVALALPDTVFVPDHAMRELHERRLAVGADLMLGVFPVDEPERLAPVELGEDGAVLRVHDKPGHRRWPNSWGLACWSRVFTDFCARWDEQEEQAASRERVLSHAFEAARVSGMRVGACRFDSGFLVDIGTPHGLHEALAILEKVG
jgi:glucose-1-phosphate thymidylyltransferase